MNETKFVIGEVKQALNVGDLVHITLNADGTVESPELTIQGDFAVKEKVDEAPVETPSEEHVEENLESVGTQ